MRNNIPARDLWQKLDETVCFYKGMPVWVTVRGPGGDRYVERGQTNVDLYIEDLPNKTNRRTIKKDDDNLDIATPYLGYINYAYKEEPNRAIYLIRTAGRIIKQGLPVRGTVIKDITGQQPRPYYDIYTVFQSKEFCHMLFNDYPDVHKSILALRASFEKDKNCGMEIATHRDIAFKINNLGIIYVYHKMELVGWIAPDKWTVNVPNDQQGWVVSRYLSHCLSHTITKGQLEIN